MGENKPTPQASDAADAIIWLSMLQLANALSWLFLPIALPRALQVNSLPSIWVAHLAGFMFLCAIVPTLLGGALCNRWGPMRLTQYSSLVCAAGLLVLGVGNTWALVLGVALIGVGYGGAAPGAGVIFQHKVPTNRRALAYSIRQAGTPIAGLLVGTLIAPLILDVGVSLLAAALCAVSVVLVSASQKVGVRLNCVEGTLKAGWVEDACWLLTKRADLRLTLGHAFAFGYIQNTIFACLVFVLVERSQLTTAQAGMAFAFMSISGAVARVVWGWLADKYKNTSQILRASAFVAATASLLLFAGAEWLAFGAAVLVAIVLGATASGWNGILHAELATRVDAHHLPSISSISIAVVFVGNFVGPVMYGFMQPLSARPYIPVLPGLALLLWTAVTIKRS